MATPHQTTRITPALENYMEAIYEQDHDSGVRVTDIAAMLNVSKASVHRAMQTLKEEGFVEQEHYGTLKLTESGLAYAKEVSRRHHVLKRFLIEVLGIDEQTADEDACRMEHVISQQTLVKWADYLKRELGDSR